MSNFIEYEDFLKIDIRVGTIIKANINSHLKTPSIVMDIDFGDKIGIKKSSAHLTKNYDINDLLGKQIIAVINFKPKQIGNLMSEVLVLGLPDENNQPVLVRPLKKIYNGKRLY